MAIQVEIIAGVYFRRENGRRVRHDQESGPFAVTQKELEKLRGKVLALDLPPVAPPVVTLPPVVIKEEKPPPPPPGKPTPEERAAAEARTRPRLSRRRRSPIRSNEQSPPPEEKAPEATTEADDAPGEESPTPEPQEPVFLGGGWYRLPSGKKVRKSQLAKHGFTAPASPSK